MTPFEKRLSEIPPRHIPQDWKASILARAAEKKRRSLFSFLSAFRIPHSSIKNLLWPHPWAWAAIATCWALIAALNFSGPRGPELYAVTPKGIRSIEISAEYYTAYVHWRDTWFMEELEPSFDLLWRDRRKL